ncbi:hypothetical protein Droror1_Dr00024261 [Drosera rotundifolia]
MILTRLFEPGGGRNGVGFKVMVLGFDVLFVGLVCSVVYCWVCCVIGTTPYLPFIDEAASRQTADASFLKSSCAVFSRVETLNAIGSSTLRCLA